MKVALIHGYSAANSGDGLLVRAGVELLREACGTDVEVTLFAGHPDSFAGTVPNVVGTTPSLAGVGRAYRNAVRTRFSDFDLVVGVGGGYLRAPWGIQSLKTLLVNVPQLRAAALSSRPTLYLPQSVGPLRGPVGWLIRRHLRGVDELHLRDDRSMTEARIDGARRTPDLAVLAVGRRDDGADVDPVPVFNVRPHAGAVVPPDVLRLRRSWDVVDGFVQSSVASNNDIASVAELAPRVTLTSAELHAAHGPRRVVVAMRLHCALEALASGHYVVHTSYERKGFGAFADLGLERHVVNVNAFDPLRVADRVRRLLHDESERRDYDRRVNRTLDQREGQRGMLRGSLQAAVRGVTAS